jgi:hypothetical protein
LRHLRPAPRARRQDRAQRPGQNSFAIQSREFSSSHWEASRNRYCRQSTIRLADNGFLRRCKANELLPGDTAYKFSINSPLAEYSQILTCPPRRLGYIQCRERDDKVPHAEQSRHLARHHTLVMSAICILVAGSQRFAGSGHTAARQDIVRASPHRRRVNEGTDHQLSRISGASFGGVEVTKS